MQKQKIEDLLIYWAEREKTAKSLMDKYALIGCEEGERRVSSKLSMAKGMRVELERALL